MTRMLAALALVGMWLPALTSADSAESAVSIVTGRELFARNCAACHGEHGRGDAPIASIFRNPPPDLTRIAARRGGWFPEALVTEIVDGRFAAHGGLGMPVWGGWLRPRELARIVDYLDAVQEQEPPGRMLYVRYCVSCHGSEGRGDAPVASILRERPPDLTTLASRDGGWFAERRIQRIVDGRLAAHGRREMPVWGHLLTKTELILLSEHLYSMQQPDPMQKP
ncbi:MAG: c-type cytochrome [Myxococcales bacterium]|nr:c-type cytochrome [Myxococcales bacterium]